MKMKKVTVELGIPEDMEISRIFNEPNHASISISLVQRKPRKMILEEVVGATVIHTGEFYTDDDSPYPENWTLSKHTFTHENHNNTVVWRLLPDEC
jgi:hypothetical protein